jgi:hypothetical protein
MTRRTVLICFVCVVGLLFSMVPTGLAGAGHRTYISDCGYGKMKYKPHWRVILACSDGTRWLQHMRWKKWTRWRAVGSGIYHYIECVPDCADGINHHRHVKIIFRYRGWCSKARKHAFKRLHLIYRRPIHGHRELKTTTNCPDFPFPQPS